MRKTTKIQALITVDPKQAKDTIVTAFTRAKAHRGNAAKLLDVTLGTFARWVKALGLGETLDRLERKAEREGWHHGRNRISTGRPRKTAEA